MRGQLGEFRRRAMSMADDLPGLREAWGRAKPSRRAVGVAIVTISAGTVAGMVASVVLGPVGDQVLARDGWANRDIYATDPTAALPSPEPTPPVSPTASDSGRRTREARSVRHAAPVRVAAYRDHSHPRRSNGSGRSGGSTEVASASFGGHSMCVRLCDGYFFPVGVVRDRNDLDAQSAVCTSACPGAPTRLYTVPSGTSEIDRAISASDGKLYTALPVAFAHTNAVGPTCTCHAEGAGEPALMTPTRDITLRDGDSVMTSFGWRVFKGNGHWPYTKANYTTLASAAGLSKTQRSTLTAMETATLGQRTATVPVLDIPVGRKTLGLRGSDGQVVGLVEPTARAYR